MKSNDDETAECVDVEQSCSASLYFVSIRANSSDGCSGAIVTSVAPAGLKIVLVGDSTVATEGDLGPGFCDHLKPGTKYLDLAVNGRSTKSFLDERLWAKALAEHGRYYFIQCGHNDQKDLPSLHTDPQTTFKANLHRYISDIRQIDGVPILVTPLSRRNYEGKELIIDPLHQYAAAARELAAQDNAPVIDL